MVGERLVRAPPLAAELVAAQRPRELARARGAARDEVAERAQLVLGRPRDEQDAVCPPAGAEVADRPRPGAGALPRDGAERDADRVVQAQCREQAAEADGRLVER